VRPESLGRCLAPPVNSAALANARPRLSAGYTAACSKLAQADQQGLRGQGKRAGGGMKRFGRCATGQA